MAISINQFEKGSFPRRVYSRTEHPVFKFLEAHQDQAHTIAEIARQIKMKDSTVRSMLTELNKDKLVQHKQPYWAIKHRKRR